VIAELPLAQVTWRDQRQPFNPNALVKLYNTAEREIGSDYDQIADDGLMYTYGKRAWTFNAQVEAVSQEFDAYAPFYASRIHTRFQRDTTRQQLKKIDVSIMRHLATTSVPLTDDNRHWSMTQISFEMNGCFKHLDDSNWDGVPANNWIEKVRVISTIDDRIETDQVIVLGREFDSGFDSGFQKTVPPVIE